MPKIRTHKGAKDRFSFTGSGKMMRMKGGKSHLRIRKSKQAKGQFDAKLPVHSADVTRLKRLLPYGV